MDSRNGVAQDLFEMKQLEEGKTYAWCACGKSENQPWCNGAHVGSEFVPKVFNAAESKTAAIWYV